MPQVNLSGMTSINQSTCSELTLSLLKNQDNINDYLCEKLRYKKFINAKLTNILLYAIVKKIAFLRSTI